MYDEFYFKLGKLVELDNISWIPQKQALEFN